VHSYKTESQSNTRLTRVCQTASSWHSAVVLNTSVHALLSDVDSQLPSAKQRYINQVNIKLQQQWWQILSLRFNGNFPGRPGLAGTRISPFWILLELWMMEVVVTTGAIRCAKLQSNHHHQQTNIQFFTGRMPFLLLN